MSKCQILIDSNNNEILFDENALPIPLFETFSINGSLLYDTTPAAYIPLTGFTINLKNIDNVTVATCITDSDGYWQFTVLGGNYHFEVLPKANWDGSWMWYADFDDVSACNDYTYSTPIPYTNALRITAGDVDQNGDIDLDDVLNIFDRTFGVKNPTYTAPDWLFDLQSNTDPRIINLNISIFANNSEIYIIGLNSGNVLGTNPNPNLP